MTPSSHGAGEDPGTIPASAEPTETVLRPTVPPADALTDTALRRTREAPGADVTDTVIRQPGSAGHSPTQTPPPPGPGVLAAETVLRDLRGEPEGATPGAPDDAGLGDHVPRDALATVVRPSPSGPIPEARTQLRVPGQGPVDAGGTVGRSWSESSSAPSPPNVSLPDRPLEVPVFRPTRGRRTLAIILVAVVALGGAVGGLVLTATSGAQPLRVDGIHIAGPGRLQCPSPVAHVRATVAVTGAGELRYRWQLPHGSPSSVQMVHVSAGQVSVPVSLSYSIGLRGGGSFRGWTRLEVVGPEERISRKVDLAVSCPA